MSALRPPVITGLAPGSGTSTVATALHAVDAGVLGPRVAGEADVVVCRPGALRHAAALACAPSGPRPLLAVVLGPADHEPGDRGLASVRTRFGAVAVLPCVPAWHAGRRARAEAAAVLGMRAEHLAAPLAAYAAALRGLVTALTAGGLLVRSAPPLVSRPSVGPALVLPPPVRVPAPAPVAVAAPPGVPAPPAVAAEPDDDGLESLLPVPTAG